MGYYLPIIITVIFYVFRIREFLITRETIPGPVTEKRSFLFLFFSGTLIFLCAVFEYLSTKVSVSYIFVIIGTLVIIVSFVVRNWAIRSLGRFWSVHVEIRDNHELVETGPYRLVRHPVYTAAILEVFGAVLLLQAYLTSLAILVLIVPSIMYRIRIEEEALIKKFGEDYRKYMDRTGSLFPTKLSLR